MYLMLVQTGLVSAWRGLHWLGQSPASERSSLAGTVRLSNSISDSEFASHQISPVECKEGGNIECLDKRLPLSMFSCSHLFHVLVEASETARGSIFDMLKHAQTASTSLHLSSLCSVCLKIFLKMLISSCNDIGSVG